MLKQYYDDDKVQNLVYNVNRFLTLVDKDEGFVGDTFKVPIIFDGSQGVSQDFATAQTLSNATSQGVQAFLVSTRAKFYGVASWAREVMLASETDAGAFMEVEALALENILRTMGNRMATQLYRSGFGDQGNVNQTNLGLTTLQLLYPRDATNFESGQRLVCSATQKGALRALGSSGNALIVTGVDRTNGIITFGFAVNDATNGIPNIANGDYLFTQGDHVSSTALVTYGIESWIPATTPAVGDNFWGVDRSQDTRLSGQRLDATDGRPLEEALIEAASIVAAEGGHVDHFFMAPTTFQRLQKSMQGRLVLHDVTTDMGIGFRGANMQSPDGEILVVQDRTCPVNRIYGLQLDTWKLASLKKLIAPVEEDGLMILRQATSDGFETRYASYAQLVCKAPGFNINIQVPTS